MNQQQFMWLSNNAQPDDGITQLMGGTVKVHLRPQVEVTHQYKKGNLIEVIFLEDQKHFTVDNQEQLEELYRIHMTNQNAVMLMREYCQKNLKEC